MHTRNDHVMYILTDVHCAQVLEGDVCDGSYLCSKCLFTNKNKQN